MPNAHDSEYGFYDRLRPEFPSQIITDITEVCNLACIHCPHPDFKKSEHYNARYLAPELNKKMVDEVKQYGQGITQYIRYTSEGEPLIHPHGYDMLEYAVRNSGVYVTLTTNGTILNQKRTEKLLQSGIHMIDISIDALTQETYAKIRVNGDLRVTQENVLRLLELAHYAGSTTKIIISYVEQPQNMHETNEFESYWLDQGAHNVIIRRLHSCSGANFEIAKKMRETNKSTKRRPCLYPWERIILNPRGHLAFCPADWSHGSTVADYRNNSIKEIWQGEFYKRLRDAHLENNFSRFRFCSQCPDWAATRWPNEGRSYADLVKELSNEK